MGVASVNSWRFNSGNGGGNIIYGDQLKQKYYFENQNHLKHPYENESPFYNVNFGIPCVSTEEDETGDSHLCNKSETCVQHMKKSAIIISILQLFKVFICVLI